MKKNIFWIDFVRATACLMIIALHASASYFNLFKAIPEHQWVVATLVDSFMRCAVPIFLMLSGFLLAGSTSGSPNTFLARRLSKILPPLLLFSFLGLAARSTFLPDVKFNPLSILIEPAYYHLWFFYVILVLYLLFPLIGRPNINSGAGLTLTLILIVLAGGAKHLGFSSVWFSHEPLFVYFLFALSGVFAGELRLGHATKLIALATSLASGILIAILTWHASTGSASQIYFEYVSIPVAVSAISTFIFLKSLADRASKKKNVSRFVQLTAKYSLAIYGFHAFAIDTLWRYLKEPFLIPAGPLVGVPILMIFSFAISCLIIRAILLVDRKGLLIGAES